MLSSCQNSEYPSSASGIVFDGDPGTDDAMAIKLLSLHGPEPDWCVSTFGNMPWSHVNRNMNILVRAFGFRSRAAVGAKAPYDGHTVSCGDFHGADGLAEEADRLFRAFGMTQAELDSNGSIEDLAEYICSRDEITYIATGPLTTLAHLIEEYPGTISHIKRLYVMGGGIHRFNKDGDREYNFAGDGIAVMKVFDSPLDITLFPLDITEVCSVLSEDDIASLEFPEHPFLKAFLMRNCRSNQACGIDGAVMHDCLPVLYLQQPSRFLIEDMSLRADSTGRIGPSQAGRHVHVAVSCPKDLVLTSLAHK